MKKDRRIIKTKKAIRNALVGLIEEKSFEAITVTDLTERADVNRGTFYLHYEDKFDLLRKVEDEILNHIGKILTRDATVDFFDNILDDQPIKSLVELFTFISDNKKLFKAILGPTGDRQFYNNLKSYIIDLMFNRNKENNHLLAQSDISPEYFTAYVSSAHLGIIEHWLNKDLDLTPHELATLLTKMFKIGPSGVLLNVTSKT